VINPPSGGRGGTPDVVVASDDATFGLPEVDRGALGAATHLARLVPQHLMRALYYTASTVTAQQLHHHGSVYRVVPRDELDDAAMRVAREIAAKDTRVIRKAKEAINGIDPQHVHRSYRFEQGFTFETFDHKWKPVDHEGMTLIQRPLARTQSIVPNPSVVSTANWAFSTSSSNTGSSRRLVRVKGLYA
jgi:hypothetical protein